MKFYMYSSMNVHRESKHISMDSHGAPAIAGPGAASSARKLKSEVLPRLMQK